MHRQRFQEVGNSMATHCQLFVSWWSQRFQLQLTTNVQKFSSCGNSDSWANIFRPSYLRLEFKLEVKIDFDNETYTMVGTAALVASCFHKKKKHWLCLSSTSTMVNYQWLCWIIWPRIIHENTKVLSKRENDFQFFYPSPVPSCPGHIMCQCVSVWVCECVYVCVCVCVCVCVFSVPALPQWYHVSWTKLKLKQ